MGGKVGAPDAGASGSAGNTQHVVETSEQVKHIAAEYVLQTELAVIEEALGNICEHDPAFADHRRGLVDYPHFSLTAGEFRVDVTILLNIAGGTA